MDKQDLENDPESIDILSQVFLGAGDIRTNLTEPFTVEYRDRYNIF